MSSPNRFKAIAVCLVFVALVVGCERSKDPVAYLPPDMEVFDAGGSDSGQGDFSLPCQMDAGPAFDNAHGPFKGGDETVDLEVVVFSNFNCSHCANFAALAEEIWSRRADINDRVRIYFHHYPFDNQLHWEQHQGAKAGQNQGMENFWALHDYIYQGLLEGKYYDGADLIEFANTALDLNMDQFKEDLAAEDTRSFVRWDKEQGIAAGVTGTPTVFICGQKINWQRLESSIDSYLD